MIRLDGIGSSGDRSHHPPPPAPSLSSSTLSPLAPPFTVDRWVPTVANPNSLPPPPPTGAISPYFVPTGDSVWSSSTSGASRLTNLNSGLASVESTPCYPYYDPALDSVDDTLEKMSNYKGYVGGWSGTFDLEKGRPARGSVVNSPWMDGLASCQMSSALKKRGTVDNFSAYDNSFDSWHGAHNEPSLTHGYVGSKYSEWLDDSHQEIYVDKSRVSNDSSFPAELNTSFWPSDGSSYFYSPETTSVVKECDAFIPSPYERYVRQLISCSRDLEGHCPAQTSSSRQAYAPSNEKNESVLSSVLKHGNSVIQHGNLHGKNDDCVDYAVGMQNEASIHENAEGNEGFVNMCNSGDEIQRNRETPDYSLQIKCFPSGNSSALGQSIDSLQAVKFGFKVGNLSCCNAPNSESGTFIPDDSMQTTKEIPDHLNVAVDSPCWKGTSVSRRCPFGSDEILQPLVINLTSDNDGLVQGQRSQKIQSDIDGTFACNKNGKYIDLSPVTDLSGSDLKFPDCTERESNPANVENGKEIKQHDICGEHNIVLNEQVSVPQGIDHHVRNVSQVESIIWNAGSNTSETIPAVQNSDFVFNHISTPNSYSSSNTKASNGEMNLSSLNAIIPDEHKKPLSSDAPSKCLSRGQDTRVLVKAMLSLSEVLLCHYSNDDMTLEECDLKPMQQIIDNLEAVSLLNKKGITGSSSRVPRVEETQPEVEVSKAEMNSDEVLTDAKENENAMSTVLKNVKNDNMVKSFSTNFKVSDGMAQEQDPKILLYKNLWVQTEATLCSLKHDIALMKLEMESFKQLFKAKSLVSSDGLAEPVNEHYGLNCATSVSVENPSRSNSEVEKNHNQRIPKDEEIDTSVIARYRILKGRDVVALSGLVEPQELNAIKSSVDREKVGEMKELSPNLADKNAIEKGVLQSHNASKFIVTNPKNMTGEKVPALDHGMGSGLLLNSTESAGVQPHLSASGGSVIQSYNPNAHGRRLFSSGSGSPSSEWEHVQRDEFIW